MYLTDVLQQFTSKSKHKIQSTEIFIKKLSTIQIPDNYILLPFDGKLLFTSVPFNQALTCTKTLIINTTEVLPLLTEDNMELLVISLTSTYIQ